MEVDCMNARWNHRYGQVLIALLAGLVLSGFAVFFTGQIASGVEENVFTETRSSETKATPPNGQHFVGKNTCAACHYDKYRIWKQDKHALGFEILPKKYREDPKCLICHTTGYGEPTGYKDASTPHLAGTTCESCHGPGSEHVKLAQKLFLGAETEVSLETEQKIRNSIELFLEKHTAESEEAEKQARKSIHLIRPGNACVQCHTSKAHQVHLSYDKE
jgi:hypothetical protein